MVRRGDKASCARRSTGDAGVPRATRLAVLACGLTACGGGGGGPNPPGVDAAVDAAGSTWWQPKVGTAKNWDIQLLGPVDVVPPRAMYVLDLWDLVPRETTLDYGDGDPVKVPPGAMTDTITELHARTPSTIVICHVDTGALNTTLPDARKFPAEVIGLSVPGAPATHFLDIREASRSKWISIMFERFDLAQQIGCDGVAPSHNDVASYESGFAIPAQDSYSWYTEVANQGHARRLSTGMKNGDLLSGQLDVGADVFDWLMIERCGEFDTCDVVRPFINLQKAVFAIDYNLNSDDPPASQPSTAVCLRQAAAQIEDGLFKDVALTSIVRVPCSP